MLWSPLRLTQKRWKAVYIVGGFMLTLALFSLVNLLSFEWVSGVLDAMIQFAWIYLGTRIFRGKSELLVAPRPLWRMTAEPSAGLVLGVLWLFLLGSSVTFFFDGHLTLAVTGTAEYLLLAYLYLGSSVRLLREKHKMSLRPDRAT